MSCEISFPENNLKTGNKRISVQAAEVLAPSQHLDARLLAIRQLITRKVTPVIATRVAA
jgi:hypothetical protein